MSTLTVAPVLDLDQVRGHLADVSLAITSRGLYRCACDAAALLAEVDRLTGELATARRERDVAGRAEQARQLLLAEHVSLISATRADVAGDTTVYGAAWLLEHGRVVEGPGGAIRPTQAAADAAGVIAEFLR